jgi:hypothetical protein
MELAEVKAAAELELRAKLLEAAQEELGRRQVRPAQPEGWMCWSLRPDLRPGPSDTHESP